MDQDTLCLCKFHPFIEDLHYARHDFGKHAFKVALAATAPDPERARLADIEQIAVGNGYPAGGYPTAVLSAKQSGGKFLLKLKDVTVKASGGPMAPFRCAVLYNATAALLIGFYDFGDPVALRNGDTHTLVLRHGVYMLPWCEEDEQEDTSMTFPLN